MKSNNILISGLSINNDMHDGGGGNCFICTYDFSWIFENPSTLLWADKIIITPSIQKIIDSQTWPAGKSSPAAETLKIFFDVAGEHGLIDVRDPYKEFPFINTDSILDQIEKDFIKLPERFSDIELQLGKEENEPNELFIGDHHYCNAKILSYHLSIILSKLWDAQILMNEPSYNYLKYKLSPTTPNNQKTKIFNQSSFFDLFQNYLPEIDFSPVSGNQNCKDCQKLAYCTDARSPKNAEKSIREYLQWRNYDELLQMKELHGEIIDKCSTANKECSPEELKNEFTNQEQKINKKIYSVFPKVQRWSSLTTIMSIPLIVAGVTTQSPIIASLGAGVAGMAQIAKQYTDILTNKNRWLGFRQNKFTKSRQQL